MGPTCDIWSLIILIALAALIVNGLWILIPRMHGLPHRPLRPRQIQRAIELARIEPGERVIDLNAGDGRAVVVAARDYQAYATGIEIEPVHRLVARLRALFSGVIRRVSIQAGSPFETNLEQADIVLLNLTPTLIERLRPQLERQLHHGARLVSLSFELAGWQPQHIDIGHLIFVYQMPPKPGSIDTYLHETLNLT
jgi:SAM-dependent methyltransferase